MLPGFRLRRFHSTPEPAGRAMNAPLLKIRACRPGWHPIGSTKSQAAGPRPQLREHSPLVPSGQQCFNSMVLERGTL